MSKPVLLDLFCGAGGAAMGYHRAGFEVVGVDINPQPRYPFTFRQADALTYPLDGFDAIHASPPCQEYSATKAFRLITGITNEHPRLVDAMYTRLRSSGVPWIIENVAGAPMPDAIELCGSMFGLLTIRHRWFAGSHLLWTPGRCQHGPGSYNVIGDKVRGYGAFATGKVYLCADGAKRTRESYQRKAVGQAALGIDWMTVPEMSQAIPPAYTEWLGRQLIEIVRQAA